MDSMSSISCALNDEMSNSNGFDLGSHSYVSLRNKRLSRKQSNLNPNIEKKILNAMMNKRIDTQIDPSIINLFRFNESQNSSNVKQIPSTLSLENGTFSYLGRLMSQGFEKESMISLLESRTSALF